MNELENIKTGYEIGTLAQKLNTNNQAYVLNTINALLFSQQTQEDKAKKGNHKKN